MKTTIKRDKFHLSFEKDNDGLFIAGGQFGAITVSKTPLFTLTLRNLATREDFLVSSTAGWGEVTVREHPDQCRFFFRDQNGMDLTVTVLANVSECGITFKTHISNLDERFSVIEASYPIPQPENDIFDLFVTSGPGRVVPDLRHTEYTYKRIYPSLHSCMQYMALFAEGDCLYVGHHDREGRTKYYDITSADGECRLAVSYPAEGMGLPANSFSLRGGVTWEYLRGDWYDAAMRYAAFAKTADWIPAIGSYGRPDTPDYFKEIPFWIMDFMPNIPEQGDNMPERLRYAVKNDKDAWWREAIRIKKALDLPVGYHIYNWHKNAFNIDYPHFLPEKDDFKEGVRRVRDEGIYIAPYINSSSWESRDNAPSAAESFAVAGIKAAAKDKDGKIIPKPYPQIKPDGEKTVLISACPATATWQRMISRLSERIEDELEVDGVYYDETSAMPAYPCTDPTHNHTPGNSGSWVESIRHRMWRIRGEKDPQKFSFSECNSEPYMNAFDGYLTWHWGENGEVPAFPAIYSRYVTMLGRVINGWRKNDKFLVRYTFALSYLFGQQLGWCNYDVQDDPEVFPFLYRLTHLRYDLKALFITGSMLRPPHVESDLADHTSTPHMWGKTDLVMPAVLSGAWREKDGTVHLFVLNPEDKTGHCKLTLRASEYGIKKNAIPEALAALTPTLDEKADTLTLSLTLKAQDIVHITF